MIPEHFDKLTSQFPAREYALLKEVRDAAGHNAGRSVDALAMALWPSRGLEMHGIEAKSGRGDWLKELKNPAKQESIFQYCERFWLYATNTKVVLDIAEIPKTWGYMVLDGRSIKVLKPAPLLKPKAVSKTFLAAILKRATEGLIHPDTIVDRIKSERENAVRNMNYDLDKLTKEAQELRESIRSFETASGLQISGFNRWKKHTPAEMAQAVRRVLDGDEDTKRITSRLETLQRQAGEIKDAIDKQLGIPVLETAQQ